MFEPYCCTRSQDKNKTVLIQQRYNFIHTNMLVVLMVTEVLTGQLPWPKSKTPASCTALAAPGLTT